MIWMTWSDWLIKLALLLLVILGVLLWRNESKDDDWKDTYDGYSPSKDNHRE